MAMSDYHLDIENEGTGTVYIKNITFTGAETIRSNGTAEISTFEIPFS